MIGVARAAWLMAEVEAAARAHILPLFRHLGDSDVRTKSRPDDLVTQADLACEAALTKALAVAWPEALVVGEEAVAADPVLLSRIGASEVAVILDPVDGTWNFANGLPVFGVIVAVTRFGQPVWGGIYDPVCDDWVVTGAGEGTQFVARERSHPLRCGSASGPLTGYLPFYLFAKEMQPRIAALLPEFGRVATLRCSAHEYRMLAQGRVDFVLCAKLMPWDHAAGVLAVREAGGVARLIDGREYSATLSEGVMLVARDEKTWEQVAGTFRFLGRGARRGLRLRSLGPAVSTGSKRRTATAHLEPRRQEPLRYSGAPETRPSGQSPRR